MRRYLILFASILSQMGLGGIYAWSAFSPALRAEHGIGDGEAGTIFGVCIASFTMSMVGAGMLQQRIGPRWVGMMGGALFGLGWWIASRSGGNFWLLLLGVGVVAGIGIGFAYVCPLSTCVRWFPHIKGLVTGLAVCGFGCGAILLTEIIEYGLQGGVPVLTLIHDVGLGIGVLVMVCSLFFALPPQSMLAPVVAPHQPIRRILVSRAFGRLFVGMFCGTFGGLLIIGNLMSMGLMTGLTAPHAALAIITFSVGNACGRIAWGIFFDRLGGLAIFVCLVAQGITGLYLEWSTIYWNFAIAAGLVGFCYGGCFVLFAAQIAETFGNEKIGLIYPYVFLAYGIAGLVGPSVGGWMMEAFGTTLYASGLLVGIAWLGAVVLRPADWV
ncbi:MAG: MFS transporter [bacterium]|jgi:OFA family oxalate/formate antiporter-like MFS transporter|nr:MFS transporter [bacterium]